MLRIAYLPDDQGRIRIAYALSRRVGNAVLRNRIRRRLRSVFAEIDATGLEAGAVRFPPGTYLVSASPDAATVPYDELLMTARSLLSELIGHEE